MLRRRLIALLATGLGLKAKDRIPYFSSADIASHPQPPKLPNTTRRAFAVREKQKSEYDQAEMNMASSVGIDLESLKYNRWLQTTANFPSLKDIVAVQVYESAQEGKKGWTTIQLIDVDGRHASLWCKPTTAWKIPNPMNGVSGLPPQVITEAQPVQWITDY